MRSDIILRQLIFLALVAAPHIASAASVSDFGVYSLVSGGRTLLPGRLYTPPEAANNPTVPRPFITFLHGGALAGTDNVRQLSGVSDGLVAEAKRRGAYLYVPQTPSNWGNLTIIDRVMTMVDRAVAEQNADSHRLYATGHSNGGGGTWNLLSRYPGRFAAAVPISAVGAASGFVAQNLVDTPIWALHARDDATVSVATSRSVVSSILAAANQSAPSYLPPTSSSIFLISNPSLEIQQELTELVHQQDITIDFLLSSPTMDLLYVETPIGGHNGLLGVYTAPELYNWLFAHSLAVPEPSSMHSAAALVLGVALLGRHRKASLRAS